jgi:type I restriction enzyme M protein
MSIEESVQELGQTLKSCADILRGSVDSGEYKTYILPLVFYAEMNRRFSMEYESSLRKAGYERGVEDGGMDKAIRETTSDDVAWKIEIPAGHSWEALMEEQEGLAESIDESFSAFASENESFQGAFESEYMNVGSFRGADGDDTLRQLLKRIDQAVYHNDADVSYDMMGEAFMLLVNKFATEEEGEYFTPTRVVRLVVELIEPFDRGAAIHDPTSGSGGMLVEAANEIKRRRGNGYYPAGTSEGATEFLESNGFEFSGQEKNPKTAGMGRMNMALHGMNGDIRHGDSLTNPKFTEAGELDTFDYILANFPFSVRGWKDQTKDRAETYGDMDWAEKLPHGNRGDFAFIMHMHSHLADTGRMATIIPHGVLFRNGDQKYRKYMLENDLVEAIIGLPENLFESTGIPSAILVLNNDKPAHREGEVMFFNADHEGRFYRDTGSNRNVLIDPIADEYQYQDPADQPIYSKMDDPTGMAELKQLFDGWESEERVCRVVSTEEIRENDHNLNIALYVDTTEPQEDISVTETLDTIDTLEDEYDQLNAQLTEYMQQLDYTEGNDNERT